MPTLLKLPIFWSLTKMQDVRRIFMFMQNTTEFCRVGCSVYLYVRAGVCDHVDAHRLTQIYVDSHRLMGIHINLHRFIQTHVDSCRLTQIHVDSYRPTQTHVDLGSMKTSGLLIYSYKQENKYPLSLTPELTFPVIPEDLKVQRNIRYIPEVSMNQMFLVEDDQFYLFSVSTENKLIFLELLEILFGPTRTFDI